MSGYRHGVTAGGRPMMAEYTSFAIGVFLVVAIMVWKKLRVIDKRLTEMQNEVDELRTIESRLFIMALNANPEVSTSPERTVPENVAAESDGGKAGGEGRDAGEGRKPDAEAIGLVPLPQPVPERPTKGAR
jgi:hypothetical protein